MRIDPRRKRVVATRELHARRISTIPLKMVGTVLVTPVEIVRGAARAVPANTETRSETAANRRRNCIRPLYHI